MNKKFHKFIYISYCWAKVVSEALGIRSLLRKSFGSMAARLVFATRPHHDTPSLIQGHQMFLAPKGRYPSPDMVVDKYELITTRIFRENLKPGMTIVDIGANIGYFTLLSAQLVGPRGIVYAIEPEPRNHQILAENVRMNGYSNVIIKEQAISNITGQTSFFLSSLDNGSHSLNDSAARGVKGELVVDVMTLDDLMSSEGWPTIDLLKVDVEGSEIMVLEGMELTSNKNPAMKMVLEYCPILLQSSGFDPLTLINKLMAMSFSITFIDETSGKQFAGYEHAYDVTQTLLKQGTYMNLVCVKE